MGRTTQKCYKMSHLKKYKVKVVGRKAVCFFLKACPHYVR